MSDTSNHYIGKSTDALRDDMKLEALEGCMRNMGALVLSLMICAVLTVCCGCSRKVSDSMDLHTTENSEVNTEVERVANVVEQCSSESKTDESVSGVLTRFVDDSLDMTLTVTEYGDDGQPKKVTEATLHRGKKDRSAGAVQSDHHNVHVEDAKRIEKEDTHLSSSVRHDETEDVKHVVERRGWWSMHKCMVLAVASAVMVAIAVWKRRKWLPVVIVLIRRFRNVFVGLL